MATCLASFLIGRTIIPARIDALKIPMRIAAPMDAAAIFAIAMRALCISAIRDCVLICRKTIP